MACATRRLEVLCSHIQPSRDCGDDSSRSSSSAALLRQEPCRAPVAAAVPRGPPVLIGGMVMDLQAHPTGAADVQRGGSVPGRVTQSAGGVARNVGEGLALLLQSVGAGRGRLPLLVSAVGDDLAGRALLQHWQALGLSTSCIAQLAGGATPTVSVVFDRGGEVAACVADVMLLETQLLPPLLRETGVASAIAAAPVVMLDGNLDTAALEEACRQAAAAGVPVWFEPVSAPKSTRAVGLLTQLAYISPNQKELAAMAAAVRQKQQQRDGDGSWKHHQHQQQVQAAAGSGSGEGAEGALRGMVPGIATLLLAGVQHIVLTLGADGAALCTLAPGRQAVAVFHVPALPATVVNCSGAGDCLVAGCLFALAQGLPAEAALAHGVAAAKAAVESSSNVPSVLHASAVQQGAAEVQARSSRWRFKLPG